MPHGILNNIRRPKIGIHIGSMTSDLFIFALLLLGWGVASILAWKHSSRSWPLFINNWWLILYADQFDKKGRLFRRCAQILTVLTWSYMAFYFVPKHYL